MQTGAAQLAKPPAKGIIVLVHGFSGDEGTWGKLPEFLRTDPALRDFEVLVWCYPAGINRLANARPAIFSQDPSIETIGKSLRTLLDYQLPKTIERIVLVGHSMGGLVIQWFLLEELLAKRDTHLSRIAEVVLLGTPSAGLQKARWVRHFNTQVRNMATDSDFIRTLRAHWSDAMEQRLTDPTDKTVSFRLTTIAGDKDSFVPQDSALAPFRYADKHVVPGDHRSMTKPQKQEDLLVSLLREIATRPSLTPREREHVLGESELSRQWVGKIDAAAGLARADELLASVGPVRAAPLPKVWKHLALALLEHEQFAPAAQLLRDYLGFVRGDTGAKPFASDTHARQQLGLALAGADNVTDAIAELLTADKAKANDPETLGLLAGRIKRHWWENPKARELGFRALRLSKQAFELAKQAGNDDQVLYNGVNAASMHAALHGYDASLPEREAWLAAAQQACERVEQARGSDYWARATLAEIALLRGEAQGARTLYEGALALAPMPRQWNSTLVQALDTIDRMQASGTSNAHIERLAAWLRTTGTLAADALPD